MTYQPDFKIRLRRGLLASLPTLNEGEPGFCTDSFDMYIGSSDGNKKFQPTVMLDSRYLLLTGSLADVSDHSHTVLTDIGSNTHSQVDTHLAGTLAAHASTTSAQLAGVISDETGSGSLVFSTTPTFTGLVTIIPSAAAVKGLIVKGVASQSANLQEWQNSSGTVLAYIDALGGLSMSRSTNSTTAYNFKNAAGTSVLNIDTTNQRVGIGTTGPGAKLDVYSASDAGIRYSGIRTHRPGSFGQYAFMDYAVGSSQAYFGSVYTGSPGVYGSINFRQYTQSDVYRDAMVINSGGNVGIGTTGPSYPLDILTTGTTGLRVKRAGANTGISIQGYDSVVRFIRYDDVTQWTMGNDNTDYYFKIAYQSDTVGTNDKLVIDTSGNVGIGTTGPTAKLHIVGSADTQQLIVKANSSQTANLQEWQNSIGTILAGINSSGDAGFGTTPSSNYRLNTNKSSSTDAITIGIYSIISPIGSSDITHAYWGGYNQAMDYNTATISTLGGFLNEVFNQSSGTITEAIGLDASVNNASTGIITTGKGVNIRSATNSGGGTFTTNYGIYVNSQTAGSNNYAIYTNAGLVYFGDSVQMASGKSLSMAEGSIATDTVTGLKIATAIGQKIGFWNTTPIIQPTTAVAAATLFSNAGTTLTSTDTFDGYTLQQIVRALRLTGLLA